MDYLWESEMGSANAASRSPEDCPTPSEAILYSLGSLARMYTTFRDFENGFDRSLPNMSTTTDFFAKLKRIMDTHYRNYGTLFPAARPCLQRLLAEYLRSCWPTTPNSGNADFAPFDIAPSEYILHNFFSKKNIAFLRYHRYEPEDLVSWAWIVTADTTSRAVRRLMALSADLNSASSESRMIPTFVFLFVLRRSDWSASALRMMINHAYERLEGYVVAQAQPLDAAYEFSRTRARSLRPRGFPQRFISKTNALIMVIRLLRQARKVWPEACVFIATLWTKYDGNFWDVRVKNSDISELTSIYNIILSLLALPASMHPFLSASAQQQAQFVIIQRMTEYDPPLAIDREGYRSVIRVQLARRKTSQERDWASLKGESWPPWKQEKLGLDAEKDYQYGQSRASQAIRYMEEAGYALQDWESSAEILAGWDTDKSPTIQRRSLYSRPVMPRGEKFKKDTLSHEEELLEEKLLEWEARVQATRTIDEAWACFLAFKDSMSRDGIRSTSPNVYEAMAEKIIFFEIDREQAPWRRKQELKRTKRGQLGLQLEETTPLPGDGKEVFESPGPQKGISPRSSAPNIDRFYSIMREDNVLPSPRGLASFLRYAKSFKKGIDMLVHSHLPIALLHGLFNHDPTSIPCPIDHDIMPKYLFSAFIEHLCNFAFRGHYGGTTEFSIPNKSLTGQKSIRINPLVQASKLLGAYKPYYQPAWNPLLQALAREGVWLKISVPNVKSQIQDILAWKTMTSVVDDMQMIDLPLEFEGFRSVCIGLQKAIIAYEELTDVADLIRARRELGCDVEMFIHNGLVYIKDLFKGIVFGGPSCQVSARSDVSMPADNLLPRLLETPTPAYLHPFIRVLGLCEDHEGLVELMEWMAEFAPELQARAAERANGQRMMRSCLTAAVIFLEKSWLPLEERTQHGDNCNNGTVKESGKDAGRPKHCESSDATKNGTLAERFRRVIAENPDWGGWPSDEEITEYMEDSCRIHSKGAYTVHLAL